MIENFESVFRNSLKNYFILRNKRRFGDERDFEKNEEVYQCSFCDDYNSQVLSINFFNCFELKENEFTIAGGRFERITINGDIRVCKSCLTRMIKILDNSMKKTFQKDFENSRYDDSNLKKEIGDSN